MTNKVEYLKYGVVNMGQTPKRFTHLHCDEQGARQEAERMAVVHGGQFAVVAIVALCERVTPVTWTEQVRPEIPF